VIAEFLIIKPLGEGGFGTVVLAKHQYSGLNVAIKFVKKDITSGKNYYFNISIKKEIRMRFK
jgi:serine/threonine protein kinase